jgi:2'-hydroxyisoflavone reductase
VPAETLQELETIEPQGPVIGRSYGAAYGGLKALCEQEASEAMNGRALNVRAGLLVGPHDPTDRFTYWPSRIARGGEVLAPGEPDRPRQLIDARDLAEWILRQVEQATIGTFNATGPDDALTMGRILEECCDVASSGARLTWVADDFLAQSDVVPWTELPLWVPRAQERPALFRANCAKALAFGLTFRPLAETIRDVLAWDASRTATVKRNAGLSLERERELLRGWRSCTR